MLALVTSVLAGSWLGTILKRGDPLLTEDEQSSPAEETPPRADEPNGTQDRPARPRESR
jgi:hypothetical protein